jgi:hypothetical protein
MENEVRKKRLMRKRIGRLDSGLCEVSLGLGGRALCRSPEFGQELRLLQHGLGGLCLEIRRIAVLAEDSLHEHAEMRADVLADGPVNRDVGARSCRA